MDYERYHVYVSKHINPLVDQYVQFKFTTPGPFGCICQMESR